MVESITPVATDPSPVANNDDIAAQNSQQQESKDQEVQQQQPGASQIKSKNQMKREKK